MTMDPVAQTQAMAGFTGLASLAPLWKRLGYPDEATWIAAGRPTVSFSQQQKQQAPVTDLRTSLLNALPTPSNIMAGAAAAPAPSPASPSAAPLMSQAQAGPLATPPLTGPPPVPTSNIQANASAQIQTPLRERLLNQVPSPQTAPPYEEPFVTAPPESLRAELQRMRQGSTVDPLAAPLQALTRQVGEVTGPAFAAPFQAQAGLYDVLGMEQGAEASRGAADIARGVGEAAPGFVLPQTGPEALLEVALGPAGLLGDVASIGRGVTRGLAREGLEELPLGAAEALVRGTPTDTAGLRAGPAFGREVPALRPGIMGAAEEFPEEAVSPWARPGMVPEETAQAGRLTPSPGVAQPEAAIPSGAPAVSPVQDIATRMSEASDPQSLVNEIMSLDMTSQLELGQRVFKEQGRDAFLEWQGLIGRAQNGDRLAAQALQSRFYRDNAVTKNRATAMAELMDAISSDRGVFAGVPIPTMKPGTLTQEATALIGLPRSIKASFDLSAPGRQGLALAFRHPKEWAQSWVPMLKAWGSEASARSTDDMLRSTMAKWNNRLGANPQQGRLLEADFAPTETSDFVHLYGAGPGGERVPEFEPLGEGAISGITRRIPGLENSERAYTTFLNSQKVKTFDTMAEAMWRAGERDPEAYRNIGNIIDHATGFGARLTKDTLTSQAFFSQRYLTSRFQFLTDPIVEGLIKGDMRAARAATENLVAFTGGMAGLFMLGNEAGVWDVELDPRSSDFGKMRIGPTRVDFGAGFLPLIRTAARVATGEAKSTTGNVYEKDPVDSALGFFRNKLAPLPSEAVSRITGENPIGEVPPPLFSNETLQQLFMPMIAEAVIETFKETGDPLRAAGVAATELVGGGVSTYGSGQTAQADTARVRFGDDYDNLYSKQQAEINAEIVQSGTPMEWRERQGSWWQARDDGFAYWKSQFTSDVMATMDATDRQIMEFVLGQEDMSGLFPGIDDDGKLAKWLQGQFGIDRAQAISAASRVLEGTGLSDLIDQYRADVLTADPDMIKAWQEAYNAGEVDYGPAKKWQEFVSQVPVGAR